MSISLSQLMLQNDIFHAANEAAEDEMLHEVRSKNVGAKSLDPNAPMEVDLITDRTIMNSNLKPVTDPSSFSGNLPTDGGLFSPIIFGRTPDEQNRQFAYIDLNGKFFHPFIFEILDNLIPKKFKKCASGEGSWALDNDGYLVELTEKDKDYGRMNNGIDWLVSIFPKMKYKESNSLTRRDRIKLLKDFKPNDCIITKWLVIPIKYRDVDKSAGTYVLPDLDVHYNSIIRYANSLKDSAFGFFNYAVKFNLQIELVAIRKYGQSLLEKKHGFFHRAILGKSIDRGSRDVISVPSFRGYQKPEDNPIDMFHSGIPLAKCLIVGYDFIMRYCLQFFADNFRNRLEYPVYRLVDGEYKMASTVRITDQLERFTTSYIEKKINRFKNSHATRFELITIKTEAGDEIPIHMAGQFKSLRPGSPNSSTILNRPMTWTDLFYQAAVNTLADKYVYITRYPIEGYNSIFPSMCYPMSTIDTVPANITNLDGTITEYDHYPVIDLSLPTDKISSKFLDTVTISNLFLSAIGGDYDGDQVSVKLCFSIEANAEAKEISESVKNFIGQDGSLIRNVGNEAYLTFYNMTRDNPVGKYLSEEKKYKLLNLKKEDLSIRSITRLFGYSTNSSSKDRKKTFEVRDPEFNLRDKLTLKPNEYINKTEIETTVGKVLFNKLMIEGTELTKIVPNGFYNVEVTASNMKKLSKMVANGCMQGVYGIVPTVFEYLRNYEFWGLCLVTIISPSYSIETIIPNRKIEEKKKELLANARSHNLNDLTKVEDELVEEAKKVLHGTPGMYLIESGARGSINDLKNMFLAIGAVENPITGEVDFMKSSYMTGINKEDIPAAANSIVNAESVKALETSKGGYMAKIFFAVYQSLMIDEPGSDCGSVNGLTVTLTKDNLEDYSDQYLMDGTRLVLITPDLPTKYLNHPVRLRSPMYCLGDKVCSKCAGKRYYKLGITNMGLGSNKLAASLQTATLKKRHDLRITMDRIDEKTILK